LPYGVFIAPTYSVLHDRHYRPLVVMEGVWPDCVLAQAKPADPSWRVPHVLHEWFYRDRTSPTHDRKTRDRLKAMVAESPALTKAVLR
jgi:hypothetical protein